MSWEEEGAKKYGENNWMHSVRRHELGGQISRGIAMNERMHSVRRHELGVYNSRNGDIDARMHSVRRHELGVKKVYDCPQSVRCIPCGDMSWEPDVYRAACHRYRMHSVRRHELGVASLHYVLYTAKMHSVRRHELGGRVGKRCGYFVLDAFRAET